MNNPIYFMLCKKGDKYFIRFLNVREPHYVFTYDSDLTLKVKWLDSFEDIEIPNDGCFNMLKIFGTDWRNNAHVIE